MNPEEIDIDGIYLIKKIESLIVLGEELPNRHDAAIELTPRLRIDCLPFA